MEIKKFKSQTEFPNEMTISGSLLGHNKEKREWVDKQSGQKKELLVDCIFLQSGIGVLVLRCFNPSFDLDSLKVGETYCFPFEEFKKENGLKTFIIRV